ncbi:MAG: sterol desaturase family protein [Deltaproteobacteria bacterium]|nr:sterol desaturase family protein [Deltaproteobacteria bacterium]
MEALVPVLIPSTYVAFLVLERVAPARRLPTVRGWLLKGFVFFVVGAAMNAGIPALLATVLAKRVPLDLRPLGMLGGAALVLLLTESANYAIHRAMHLSPWLWRWTHQMHHSAERVDIAGAVYGHPFELVISVGMSSVVSTMLGVSPDAAALGGYAGFVLVMIQHANVRTPRWLGYLVQRPEAHSVHHTRGLHAYNYAGLSFIDMLFGTFRNPDRHPDEPAGFWDGASAELWPMLAGRDVGDPRRASERLGAEARAARS